MAVIDVLATALQGRQRAVVVALALLPLFVITLFCIPALLVLPFLRDGISRTTTLIKQLQEWTTGVLKGAGPGS